VKTVISFIFLSICFILISFILIDILKYPLESLRAPSYIILTLLLAVFINLFISILRYLTNFIKSNWKFYIFQWTATLILPFIIISFLEITIKDKIFKITQEKMKTIVVQIDKNKDIKLTKKSLNFSLYRGDNIYMLKTIVPSIDIDGETIFFDSRNRKTYHFHNDMLDYYKDKKTIPIAIKRYIWLMKNTSKF